MNLAQCFQIEYSYRFTILNDIQLTKCTQVIQTIYIYLDFKSIFFISGGSAGEESAYNEGNPSLPPGLGSSSGEGTGYPLQYSWASLLAQLVKNPSEMWEARV